jgi:ketosteroid isomerase-like protein
MEVLDLVQRWAAAEEQNDSALLDGLLADGFVGVGPVGFVLSRDLWLGRFDKGLANESFAVEDAQVTEYGDAAIVVAILRQQTTVNGKDSSGRFRLTLVPVRIADRWLLGSVHIGPLDYPAARRSA